MTTTTIRPVLIVDDHDDSRDLLVELLQHHGHQVRAARSGAEALALLRELDPCLILVDLLLPDVFGIELVRRLRADATGATTPIYALSGFSNLWADALAAGCDGFLTKPVTGADLRLVVDAHCLSGSAPPKVPLPPERLSA